MSRTRPETMLTESVLTGGPCVAEGALEAPLLRTQDLLGLAYDAFVPQFQVREPSTCTSNAPTTPAGLNLNKNPDTPPFRLN